LETVARDNLKYFFVEKWQDLFSTLSKSLGFTLSIFDETGEPLVAASEESFCSIYREASPAFRAECAESCRPYIVQAAASGKPEIFKCSSNIMNFALPIRYLDQKVVILGQGSFPSYEDFRNFLNLVSAAGHEPLSISMPRMFTNKEDARKALSIVADSVDRVLQTSKEALTLRRRLESLKGVLSSWNNGAGHDPDQIYRDMLDTLSTLLDIGCLAILRPVGQDRRYTVRYSFCKPERQHQEIDLEPGDPPLHDLEAGNYVSCTIEAQEGREGLYLFPIVIKGHLEAVLHIRDRELSEGDIEIIDGFCKRAAFAIENHRLRQDLYQKFSQYAALSELTNAITPIQNDKTLLQVILDKSAELLKAEQGSLMLLDAKADVLLVEAKKGITADVYEKLKIGRGEGIAGKVAALGEPFLVENVEQDPRIRQKNRKHYKTGSCLSVPLKIENRIIGVLNLADKDGGESFNEEDLNLVQSLANQAAIIMERNWFYNKTEELKKLTITDELTGLLNRRYLHERLKDELARSERHGYQLGLLMVDLDGFKECNDTRGHTAGDRTLKDIAGILVKTVRSMDVVARYGGDEFMIILPETGRATAIEIAERMRRNVFGRYVKEMATVIQASCPVTASIGVACYPQDGKTVEALLKNVDAALYRAKNKGKNGIEVFS
jgi:diguanylate cyclase (GGDEF)-like protein